jgi:hypothetical protein
LRLDLQIDQTHIVTRARCGGSHELETERLEPQKHL